MFHTEFYFNGDAVGTIEIVGNRIATGAVRYVPFRGSGHFALQSCIRSGEQASCTVEIAGRNYEFIVSSCPSYGVLAVGNVEPLPDQPKAQRSSCRCVEFRDHPTSKRDVEVRCSLANAIRKPLDVIATDAAKWMSVLRCRSCGQVWGEEFPFGSGHGGGPRCLYQIETTNPTGWLASATPTASTILAASDDLDFLCSLGPEVGPEDCRRGGCVNKRISLSVFCAAHHFESLRGRPPPVPP